MVRASHIKRIVAVAAILVMAIGMLSVTRADRAAAQPCGPMDVVFAIDTTGSMGGALGNVQTEAASLIAGINTASGGDFQLGLLTFESNNIGQDSVVVHDDLAAGNAATVQAHILGLAVDGGAGSPEASDEALNTAINGLDAAARPVRTADRRLQRCLAFGGGGDHYLNH